MADNETVVAPTSSDTAYDSYPVTVYQDASLYTGSGDAKHGNDLAAPTAAQDSNIPAATVGTTDMDTDYGAAHHTADTTLNNDDSIKLQGTTNAAADSSEPIFPDTSVNGTIASGVGTNTFTANMNGVIPDYTHGSSDAHQLFDSSALSAEEERLWNIVRANSLDFNAWTALVEETEKSEGNILKIRRVYDEFLAEFPLCYGYWKKYADHEARLGFMDKVAEVYERAVQGVTYSVDMWLNYCVFAISTYGDPDTIRRVFERGLEYVGTDYHSSPLWDKYIEYEYTQQDWPRVAMLYLRVLENPNQNLDRYFEGFKELVASRPLLELKTAEEAAAAAAAEISEAGDHAVEGETHPNGADQSAKPINSSLKEAEELEKYIAVREEVYKKAKEFDYSIIGFETAIRRPYFHVRPLSVAELENWHSYLDFIEGVNDLNKVVKLYERCLIACANYPEYWIRYVLCLEASGSMNLVDHAIARATQVFVKRQPEIHLFAARFREKHADIEGARAAYQLVHDEISPGLLEAIVKHANMEHRLGKLEDACSLYEQAIAIEKGKEHSQTLPLLFAQYSRFLFLVSGKAEKARENLDQAVENCQLSKPLLEALIHFESVQSLPKRIEYLDSLVEKFIVPTVDNPNVSSIAEREELSSIFLEFLDLFGDAQSIMKADERHAKLFLPHRSAPESKKRHAEDYLSSDKHKLARSGLPSSAVSATGAYPGTQNQWPANYASPQGYPQAAQAQAQQWNPAYGQQPAAYGAYGTYGSTYPQQQVPASVPQTAAYGAYPPTYPAQAYAQQGYVQPAAAAAVAPAQQANAAAPAAYYGTYY